ncbi:MAG TPA: hypothetical protein VEL76_07620 [Gemmataceae bacterium]|nr:hypothetical protein [Gemmataceae bacterium]
MSKFKIDWTLLTSEQAERRGGATLPGVKVAPAKDGRVSLVFSMFTFEGKQILEAAQPLAKALEPKLQREIDALPTWAAQAEALKRLQAAQGILETLRQWQADAQAKADDPSLCADPEGAAKLLGYEAKVQAARTLAERQHKIVEDLAAKHAAAVSAHAAAVVEVEAKHRDAHQASLVANRDKARARLVELLTAAAADYAVAEAAANLGHWEPIIAANWPRPLSEDGVGVVPGRSPGW